MSSHYASISMSRMYDDERSDLPTKMSPLSRRPAATNGREALQFGSETRSAGFTRTCPLRSPFAGISIRRDMQTISARATLCSVLRSPFPASGSHCCPFIRGGRPDCDVRVHYTRPGGVLHTARSMASRWTVPASICSELQRPPPPPHWGPQLHTCTCITKIDRPETHRSPGLQ